MQTKLMVIGPSSTHVNTFIGLVKNLFDEIVYIGENFLETDYPIRQHIINFRSFNPYQIRRAKKKLNKIIQGENPTLVHIQQVNRVAWVASDVLKKCNVKFVVTAWGSDVLLIPNQNFLYKLMVKQVLKRSTRVTADSQHMIDEILKLVGNVKLELILFGIEPIESTSKLNIIYSNRALEALYRVDLIIDYFAEFYKTHKEYKLLIAGTGSELNSLELKVKSLSLENAVEFLGWLKPTENILNYQRSRIYISIPESDGTSVSLLEAMSAGCVPVVADLPVSHEWIKNGLNGVIVNKNSNPLEDVLNLDQNLIAEYNSKLIAEKATKKIASKALNQLYQNILNG